MRENLQSIVVEYENHKPIKLHKVVNVNQHTIEELKEEIKKNIANKENLCEENSKLEFKDKEKENCAKQVRNVLLSYSIFTNYVELGKCETNNDFEDMIYNFIFNKCEFVKALCPKEYLTILERFN